ncbi:MAG: tRNA guanosine(34) transglycosylase Tgt [Thermodesulfobacteriota bacterium]
MGFKVYHQDKKSKARTGQLETAHGTVNTPIFIPVGTLANVKAVHQRELEDDIKAEIILSNIYHLYLRPGLDVLNQAGGIHSFNGWSKPILTDRGGYQVYSLADNRKISEEGVTFNSHIDGSKHFFTPEGVIDIQRTIGADIIMAFDECTPFPCEHHYAKASMDLTHRWLKRCIHRVNETSNPYDIEQVMFPIVQGSVYKDLRLQSADTIASEEAEGYAIGGLSVGEPTEVMYEMTDLVCGLLPENKPRYLMGVGTPSNILECIALGVDMFDCVMPTRNARNGMLFTSQGIINIRNEKWKSDFSPIDEHIEGYANNFYSKAYLRHLVISKEILGAQIASLNNLSFYLWLIRESRKKIIEGSFSDWKDDMVKIISRKL